MSSVLERELVVITGKGGVGKTTVTAALGLLGARRGLRTIMVEVGDQQRLPALFGYAPDTESGVEVELQQGLSSLTIDPDRVLVRWLAKLGGRVSARVMASSNTFQYFVAAAPGAREMLSLVEVWELGREERGRKGKGYDLVILDAPATGHALAMLSSPRTFATIARVGPIATQAQRVRELLADPLRSGYLAVALGTEMAITETLELKHSLRRDLDRELDAIVVNGTLQKRFQADELARIDAAGAEGTALGPAARAARAASVRGRTQQSQIARLRRRSPTEDSTPPVFSVPFLFQSALDLDAVQSIADELERKL